MSALALSSTVTEVDFSEFSLSTAEPELVRASFNRLEPASELVGILFFLRLFDIDPKLREQFEGPIKPHAIKMMATLRLAVVSLKQRQGAKSALRLLGTRLRQKGMKADDYTTMADALIWTLEKSLEDEFTYSVRRAWKVYLSQITSVMTAA